MINYSIIHDSTIYYEQAGFQRIESPWAITKGISNITKPMGADDFTIAEKNKVLVASGEQSFLYLYSKGFLPKGKFQTITPCFRNDTFDEFHTKYFIKNELIITDDVSKLALISMVRLARNFFRKYCLQEKLQSYAGPRDIGYVDDVHIVTYTGGGEKIIVTDFDKELNSSYLWPSYDLEYNEIELGSYGIRRCGYLNWIYGTGVAEPRLTRTLKKCGVKNV